LDNYARFSRLLNSNCLFDRGSGGGGASDHVFRCSVRIS